jgi:hypothetical protein
MPFSKTETFDVWVMTSVTTTHRGIEYPPLARTLGHTARMPLPTVEEERKVGD